MKYVSIENSSRTLSQALTAPYCVSFMCRLRGLTFRRSLALDKGLLLVQGKDSRIDSSIHMLFVWMDLAVIWINDGGEVVDTCLAKSWRPAYFPKAPARYILEINAERLSDFQVGDIIKFQEVH